MSDAPILTELRGDGDRRVGLVTQTRPKQLNALNHALMEELRPGSVIAGEMP